MTSTAINVAIAEACGIDCSKVKDALEVFKNRDGYPDAIFKLAKIPDYPGDLNAMHEAEQKLTKEQELEYRQRLVFGHGDVFATAAQRSEAFLRIIGKWEEQP